MANSEDSSSQKLAKRSTRGRGLSRSSRVGSVAKIEVKLTKLAGRNLRNSAIEKLHSQEFQEFYLSVIKDGGWKILPVTEGPIGIPSVKIRQIQDFGVAEHNAGGIVEGSVTAIAYSNAETQAVGDDEGSRDEEMVKLFEYRMAQLDGPEEHLGYIRHQIAEASKRGVR